MCGVIGRRWSRGSWCSLAQPWAVLWPSLGQRERERTPLTTPRAFGPDPPAMGFDQVLADVQSQAQPVRCSGRLADAIEAVKEPGQLVRGIPDPGIAHAHESVPRPTPDAD